MGLLEEYSPYLWKSSLAIILAVVVLGIVQRRLRPYLRDIPGPFLASISDIWLLQHYARRKGTTEYALHQRYDSPLLRLGPNTVSVADNEAARIIYGWKPVFKKSRLYISQHQTSTGGETITNVSAEMNEEKHGRIRRPIASAYAMGSVLQYEPLVDDSSRTFMRVMSTRFAGRSVACDFSKWLQMYAFDVIGEMTFSKQFGFLKTGEDVERMMYHTGRAMDWIGMIGQIPDLDELLRLKIYARLRSFLGGSSSVVGFSAKQVREYSPPEEGQAPDFLSKFLKGREKYPEIFTDAQLVEFVNTNVGGGSDTTAIVLRELVYRFLTKPESLQRFLKEIKTVLAARDPSTERERPITFREGQSMPYFQACVQECLRIHPPLGQMLPRVVPEGGVVLCEKFLPAGTIVGSNGWTVSRDRSLFGDDADEYRPERWLSEDIERVKKMENASLTFGGGPRVCIGKNIALLEVNKFIPELFRRYELTVVHPEKYYLVPGWLVLQHGLYVKMDHRQSL